MAMIARDLMVGNPRLAEIGFGKEALGHNGIAAGFQGQRHWTDFMPNGDFLEAILNSSFDWNGIRQPYIVATENDSLNGTCMLFGHLLTGSAQIFSDVRTYWSADAIERVTGYRPTGLAENGVLHLINSGPSALDGTGQQEVDGKPVIKPWWDVTADDAIKCLDATEWCASITEYFRGGGWSTDFLTRGGMPVTLSRLNLVKGLGPVLQLAEGFVAELPAKVHDALDIRTNSTWPTTWFVPNVTTEDMRRKLNKPDFEYEITCSQLCGLGHFRMRVGERDHHGVAHLHRALRKDGNELGEVVRAAQQHGL